MISYTLERSSLKKTPLRVVFFNSLLGVSSGDETLRLMLDILHQKEKSYAGRLIRVFFPLKDRDCRTPNIKGVEQRICSDLYDKNYSLNMSDTEFRHTASSIPQPQTFL